MTDATNRNRVQAGVSTGGQFATEPKTESGIALAPAKPAPVPVGIHARVRLSTDLACPVPPFPASLGEPELTYSRDAESDQVTLTISTDRIGNVSFWDGDCSVDVYDYHGEDLTSAELDALIRYGAAVRTNVDVLQYEVDYAAGQAVQDQVLAIATGNVPQEDISRPASTGAERAERVMRSWVEEVDTEPETALQDAFTDLLHFARARGIDPEQALAKAYAAAEEEQTEQAAAVEG